MARLRASSTPCTRAIAAPERQTAQLGQSVGVATPDSCRVCHGPTLQASASSDPPLREAPTNDREGLQLAKDVDESHHRRARSLAAASRSRRCMRRILDAENVRAPWRRRPADPMAPVKTWQIVPAVRPGERRMHAGVSRLHHPTPYVARSPSALSELVHYTLSSQRSMSDRARCCT